MDQLRKGLKKRPQLGLLINEAEQLDLFIKENLHSKNVLTKASPNDKQRLTQGEQMYYNPANIDGYNNWFDNSKGIVEQFNKNIFTLESQRSSYKKLNISLTNTGGTKANDIKVILTFPEELIIYNDSDNIHLEKINFPSNIHKPPHVKAQDDFERNYGSPRYRDKHIPNNINYELTVKKQNLEIDLSNLLHKQSVDIGKYYPIGIMAKSTGNFVIHVQIICEEYEDYNEYDFPVHVSHN